MMYSYRIVEDGNGDLIAQKQILSDGEWRWVFFIDLDDCDGNLNRAEMKLRSAVLAGKQQVLGHYDEDGNRID